MALRYDNDSSFLSKKEKTVTRSFRISESVFKALEEDATRRNVSVNTLLNQLLLAYTNWGRFIDRVGAIRTSKVALRCILNASSDEGVIDAAREVGPDTPKSIILAKHGALSLATVLDYVRNASMYGGFAEYNEVETQGKMTITLMHELGRKGSLFISNTVESLFRMINIHPKMSSSEHTVIIEI